MRRTPELQQWLACQLNEQARRIIAEYDPEVLARASRYLYLKETKSSYEIERDQPDQRRMLRFIEALQGAHRLTEVSKELLVSVQQTVLDERYAEEDYRDDQSYVGETAAAGREIIHHIGAKPEDMSALMAGLVACHQRMRESAVDPVIQAAVIAFGFVYVHPFDDGNGRVHRFLIHQTLASAGYTPEGLIFPVSAAMLAALREYDDALESVSRPRLPLIPYTLHLDGALEVHSDTVDLYRYWDATTVCTYLYRTIERTINEDLVAELNYLVGYDQAKRRAQGVVDMPDRKLDLFIRLTMENGGRLSHNKRKRLFEELTDEEVSNLEEAVREAMRTELEPNGPDSAPEPG